MITVLKNAVVFDGASEELLEGASVVVEDDRIREVGKASPAAADRVVDCGGRFLMPGLIDAHFHAYSPTFDINWLDRMPKPLLVSYAARHLEGALHRGFTTVRDPGGGDVGLAMAIERGLMAGPRFFYGGRALSQTGGHGDIRPAHHEEPCNCSYSGVICHVVDGADAVRKAAREELRKGADHIKVFISGGVGSPTDPIWMPQFTNDELRAAVEEAATRRKYVVAHCHTDDGARRCVEVGIRSIDHATHITDDTAHFIAASGTTYTVPTLAVVHMILKHGTASGLPESGVAKLQGVLGQMLASIESCRRAGVKIGLGTDIFGVDFHHLQSHEFTYRGEVDKPIDVLRAATSINAEIMQKSDLLGAIKPGAYADLLVLDGNPFNDLALFQAPEQNIPVIMKAGQFARQRL